MHSNGDLIFKGVLYAAKLAMLLLRCLAFALIKNQLHSFRNACTLINVLNRKDSSL